MAAPEVQYYCDEFVFQPNAGRLSSERVPFSLMNFPTVSLPKRSDPNNGNIWTYPMSLFPEEPSE